MKVWYLICFSFLAYSVSILINEKNKVNYNIKEFKIDKTLTFSLCFPLSFFYVNEVKINITNARSDMHKTLVRIKEIKRKFYNSNFHDKDFDIIIDYVLNLKEYFIFKNQICLGKFKNYTEFVNVYAKFYHLGEERKKIVFNDQTFDHLFYGYNKFLSISIDNHYTSCSKLLSKFKCLNDCNRKYQNISRYYFDSKETVLIDLEKDRGKKSIFNERICDKECKSIKDCQFTYFILLALNDKLISNSFEAYLLIGRIEFFFQFISLIFFFFGVALFPLLLKFLNYLAHRKCIKKIKIKKSISKLISLKFFYFIAFLLLFLIYFEMYLSYVFERDNPETKGVLNADEQDFEFSVVVCVNLVYNLHKPLSKIEKWMLKKSTIKDVYFKFLDKKIRTKWSSEPKVLIKFEGMIASRCQQINLPVEPKFRSIFSLTHLVIEYNDRVFVHFFLVPRKETFNSHSFESTTFNFKKIEIIRSRLNRKNKCIDYKKEYGWCTNRYHCIDVCTSKEFYKKYKNITKYSIVDKDHYTAEQWNNAFINDSKSIFNIIENKCNLKYASKDCTEIIYKESFDRMIDGKYPKLLDLYCDTRTLQEDEHSAYNLLFDILNIHSFFLGQNVLQLSLMVFKILRKKFRLKSTKFYILFIYLLCLFGFVIHLYLIFDKLLDSENVNSQYYEFQEQVELPELMFCFDIQTEKINPNYKLTLDYLKKSTRHLNIFAMLLKVKYLNESYEWAELDQRSYFRDQNFEIKILYFLDKKCYKLDLKVKYNEGMFRFRDDNHVLKLYFNKGLIYRSHLHKNKVLIFFIAKLRNKMQLTKMYKLDFFPHKKKQYFEISQEFIKNEKRLFKNPLSLASLRDHNLNDDQYLSNLEKKFRTKYNYKTLNFPLPINDIDLEINNELFEQFFILIQVNSFINFNNLKILT